MPAPGHDSSDDEAVISTRWSIAQDTEKGTSHNLGRCPSSAVELWGIEPQTFALRTHVSRETARNGNVGWSQSMQVIAFVALVRDGRGLRSCYQTATKTGRSTGSRKTTPAGTRCAYTPL